MSIKYFETQEELDKEFERIEEINYQFAILKEEVEEAKQNLSDKQEELKDFVEDNKEYLIDI